MGEPLLTNDQMIIPNHVPRAPEVKIGLHDPSATFHSEQRNRVAHKIKGFQPSPVKSLLKRGGHCLLQFARADKVDLFPRASSCSKFFLKLRRRTVEFQELVKKRLLFN